MHDSIMHSATCTQAAAVARTFPLLSLPASVYLLQWAMLSLEIGFQVVVQGAYYRYAGTALFSFPEFNEFGVLISFLDI